MARSIWTGSISFGLVNIPIRLYAAVSQKEVSFHQLHEKDGARIQWKRFCSREEKEVPWEEIARGFEISKGRYVMVEEGELEKLDPKSTRTIEISDFVELDRIDPIYWEHTYYLAPDRGAEKAYALLLEAMRRTGKVAIARVVLRTKQYLCTLRPMESALVLSTMLFDDEVVKPQSIEALAEAPEKPAERELKMAEQLVESLASDWKPAKYTDEYRERVLALLHRKAEGKEIVVQPEAPPAPVINLVDALKASLKAKGAKPSEAGAHRLREEPRAAARRGRAPKGGRKTP